METIKGEQGMAKQIRRNTCKYCKINTHNVGVCPYCREKLEIIARIQAMLK